MKSCRPIPVPHAPAGDFRRPAAPQGLVCWCGAALARVSNDASDPARLDWMVVDAEGRAYVDWTPTFRYRTPDGEIITIDMHDADAWDRLSRVDIGKYSMLRAQLGLGGSFYHPHREDTSKTERAALDVDPPRCHEKWMWAAPDGWRCREAMTTPALAPYAVEATATA